MSSCADTVVVTGPPGSVLVSGGGSVLVTGQGGTVDVSGPDGSSCTVVVQETNATIQLSGPSSIIVKPSTVDVVTVGTQGPQGIPGPPGPGGGGASTYDAVNKSSQAFAIGQVLAVHSSGLGVVLAGAADNNANAVGLATVGAGVGAVETVQTGGVFTLSDWSAVTGTVGLAARAVYYLDVVPGKLTLTPPGVQGNIVQVVGRSLSTTQLEFLPTPVVML